MAAQETADGAAKAPGIVLGEDDVGSQNEIRGDHLAAAEIRVLTQLTRGRKLALLHRVLHSHPALDHEEAVGLLNHQADQAGRGLQPVSRERLGGIVLRLGDCHRAHRLVTLLQAVCSDGPRGSGGTGNRASARTLLVTRRTVSERSTGEAHPQDHGSDAPRGRAIRLLHDSSPGK